MAVNAPAQIDRQRIRELIEREEKALNAATHKSEEMYKRADAVLASSPQTALISVSHWEDDGTRETDDVVLARDGERCHVFLRDPDEPSRLVAQGLDEDERRDLITRLAVPRRNSSAM